MYAQMTQAARPQLPVRTCIGPVELVGDPINCQASRALQTGIYYHLGRKQSCITHCTPIPAQEPKLHQLQGTGNTSPPGGTGSMQGPTSCPVPSHLALLMVSVLTSVQYTWSSRESQSRATALRTSASGMTSSDRSSVSKLIRRMSILRAKSRNLSRPDQRPRGVSF